MIPFLKLCRDIPGLTPTNSRFALADDVAWGEFVSRLMRHFGADEAEYEIRRTCSDGALINLEPQHWVPTTLVRITSRRQPVNGGYLTVEVQSDPYTELEARKVGAVKRCAILRLTATGPTDPATLRQLMASILDPAAATLAVTTEVTQVVAAIREAAGLDPTID
ncbi:MAG TPA: hypothetical protein VLI05_01775 [Candidatus Saccharimonadia bacterium]|nr:hypothetical protein [Candidatus Saccharimonadia bacterium]